MPIEIGKPEAAPARYPIRDQQLRHAAASMAASSHAGENTPEVARGLYRFLTERTEPESPNPRIAMWDELWREAGDDRWKLLPDAQQKLLERLRAPQLPTPPEGMHYVLEPTDAVHFDLYGQRVTQAQYDAVVRHLRPAPAHGLAVGDTLNNADKGDVQAWLDRVPVGGVVTDLDGDGYTKTARAWHGRYYVHPGDEAAWLVKYQPLTIDSLPEPIGAPEPEPEDTTPRVGDTVRVRQGARHCTGFEGTLTSTPGAAYEYGVRDEREGHQKGWQHNGPLSDFELIERAK
jgi:hypothetical protein